LQKTKGLLNMEVLIGLVILGHWFFLTQ
jgi:hypothetical protein